MLLYKIVPAFKDIWIECTRDLTWYRIGIKEDDVQDREVFQNIAKH